MTVYATLVADPPWPFGDKLPGPTRGAGKNYPLLSFEDIENFKLPELLPDARLFLWRVSSMVEEAYRVCRAWGFEPKSEIVWSKETKHGKDWFGMGRRVRLMHEIAIIAERGKPAITDRSIRSVFRAECLRHSGKPEVFFDLVEKLSPGPYVELFARRQRKGWTCLGGGRDLRVDFEVAVRQFLEANSEIASEYALTRDAASFDAVTRRYETPCETLEDAVRLCMGKGGRYFDAFDLDTLNETAPAIHNREGRKFLVPETDP